MTLRSWKVEKRIGRHKIIGSVESLKWKNKKIKTQQGKKKNAVGTLLKIVAVKCGKLNSFMTKFYEKVGFTVLYAM